MTNNIQNDSKLFIEFESGIKIKSHDDAICSVQFVSGWRFTSQLTQFLKVLHMTNSIQNDSKLHIEFESGIKMKNNDDTICGVQFVSDRRFDSHLTQFLKVLHMTNSILNDCKLCIEFESGIKRKNHGDAKSGINICLKNQNLSLDKSKLFPKDYNKPTKNPLW